MSTLFFTVFLGLRPTYTTKLINILLLALLVGTGMIGFVTHFEDIKSLILSLAIAPVIFFIVWRGHARLASKLVVVGLALVLTLIIPVTGGVQATAYSGFVVVVMMAGLLMSSYAAIAVAIFASLLGVIIMGGESADLWSMAPSPADALTTWVIYTVYFAVTAMILSISIQIAERALQRAHAESAERLATEQKLEESARRFQALIEKSYTAMILVNEAGLVTYMSPAALSITG